ncbi:D-cysteine desulfhydrase [Consotaella aegiceratis]|uniref:D-cysteine desulfhydrase n=1 Tax=Consotaella aegiceratis TaxID=3097961 RepID=UPI002F3F4B5B
MHLARFPRVRFCHAPTAIEPMRNLTQYLGGPQIWIKRDDCTGLATGGNKTRKLEFLIGEAQALGADRIITQGAVQSNHVRQTAAAAAIVGMKCSALLEHRIETDDEDYLANGNVFLDRLLGADLDTRPGGADMQQEMVDLADTLRVAGERPYIIPGGGSNPVGALGYVACAQELVAQADDRGLRIDHVVHATGSTGTQAGLVVGLQGSGSGIPVIGISVRAPKARQEANVHRLVGATADYLGLRQDIPASAVEVDDGYVGDGYGVPTPGMAEAVRLAAALDGILLDPVYSGKGMAGLIGLIRAGRFKKSENVLFVHTGGAAGLFAYRNAFGGESVSAH